MICREKVLIKVLMSAQVLYFMGCGPTKKQYKDEDIRKPDASGYLIHPSKKTGDLKPTNPEGGKSNDVVKKLGDVEQIMRRKDNSRRPILLNKGAGGITYETTLVESYDILSESPYLPFPVNDRGKVEKLISNPPESTVYLDGIIVNWSETTNKPVWMSIGYFSDIQYHGGIFLGDDLPPLPLKYSLTDYLDKINKTREEKLTIEDIKRLMWQNFSPTQSDLDCYSGDKPLCIDGKYTDGNGAPIAGLVFIFMYTGSETDNRMIEISIKDEKIIRVNFAFLNNDM